MVRKKLNPTLLLGVQALLIYVWLTDLSALAGTDTYYSVYLLCGAAALGVKTGYTEAAGRIRSCGSSRGCARWRRPWATMRSTNRPPCKID